MASPIRALGLTLRYLAPLLLIAGGVLIARALILSRAEPEKLPRDPKRTPVEVVTLAAGDYTPLIRAYGIVEARGELVLRPTVGGPVVAVHPNLIGGGRIAAGEVLLEIDRRDYELEVATTEASLVAAQAELEIERGNAAVAAAEWKLLEGSLDVSEEGKSLALREPYVKRREADVATAEARLANAELALERTRIVAPFDALVLSESVEVGTQIGVGSEVARLADLSEFLIEVSVPADRLAWLALPRPGEPEPEVALVGLLRRGRLVRLMGEVDPAGRMARVQVAIPDPLDGEGAPLLLGSYAAVDLPCLPVGATFSVPRGSLREGDQVWLVDGESRLELRKVEVLLRRDDDVLVASGLVDGERVVTSQLSTPVPGMLLDAIDPDAPPPGSAPDPDATALLGDRP